jgi:ribosomal-protein-alanine N-acetyltransferase
MKIRPATPADVSSFHVLERESPEAAHWSQDDYEQKLRHSSTLSLVAEVPDAGNGSLSVAGFLLGQVAADEMEILNFAVASASRRQGLGRKLLEQAFTQAAERGVRRCWLEVRVSNQAALLFYQSQGFAELYRRQKYYCLRGYLEARAGSVLPCRWVK